MQNSWEIFPTFGLALLRDSARLPPYRRPMALDRIQLTTFRNHPATRLDGTRAFNLLVGENGAGKTNVLEALSLLAPGRGLRRAALPDLAAQHGPGTFAISAELGDGVQIGTGTLAERPSRRTVQINGAEVPAVRLGEWLSLGWLTPVMDRLFRVGSVDFDTAGTDDSNFIFAGVNDPQRVVAAVAEAQRESAAMQPAGTPPATGV